MGKLAIVKREILAKGSWIRDSRYHGFSNVPIVPGGCGLGQQHIVDLNSCGWVERLPVLPLNPLCFCALCSALAYLWLLGAMAPIGWSAIGSLQIMWQSHAYHHLAGCWACTLTVWWSQLLQNNPRSQRDLQMSTEHIISDHSASRVPLGLIIALGRSCWTVLETRTLSSRFSQMSMITMKLGWDSISF